MHRHRHDRMGEWHWVSDRMARGWHVLELPDFVVKLVARAGGSYWPRYEGPFWIVLERRGGPVVALPETRDVYMGLARAKAGAAQVARERVMYNLEKIWAATVMRPTVIEER